jgi:transposase
MRPYSGIPATAIAGRARLRWLEQWVWCAAIALLVAMPVFAKPADPVVVPRGEVQLDKAPRDPDFGVSTRHPGLQRHVEMYQWTRVGDSYALAWRGARVDSSGFAPGHDNPKSIPLREREWHAAVSIDGRHVADAIVTELGAWRTFRPNFSALPGNMSATFQPEADGLGSADNPLAPQVGDLRVTWRAFVLPPMDKQLVLRGDRWALRPTPASAAVPPPIPDAARSPRDRSRWLFSGAGIVLLAAVAAVMRRRRRKPAN